MLKAAEEIWNALSGKIRELIREEMRSAMHCERWDVTTAPDGSVIGVTQPFGSTEIFIPYSQEVSTAAVGDTVLVVWWNNMSTAKAYYFGNGYDGGGGGGTGVPAGGTASQILTKHSATNYDMEWGMHMIPYAQVDSTSTSTAFTATVPGITALKNGVSMMLKNGVATSAAGFTININGLGAKPSYNSMAAATQDTTIFNVNYTMLFVYDETRVEGGCWICYRGYNSTNDNTIGYQIRTNSQSMAVSGATYRYRLLFTSADGKKYVPANTSSSTSATSAKTVNQTAINPWGDIFYYSSTSSVSSGSRPGTSALWRQYNFTLGYSFNRTGSALTLTSWNPVYIKCAPQSDGSAIMDSDTPFVQALPSTEDGKIYIFLGIATSATAMEMSLNHPVYEYKSGAIRLWTNAAS